MTSGQLLNDSTAGIGINHGHVTLSSAPLSSAQLLSAPLHSLQLSLTSNRFIMPMQMAHWWVFKGSQCRTAKRLG